MNTGLRKKRILNSFTHALYLLLFISLIFSFRAISSICIGAILLAGIVSNRLALPSLFQKDSRKLFLAGCALLFLLQVVALLYTNDMQQGLNNVRIKAGLLITPLAICFSFYLNADTRKKLFSHYCLILAVATLYCLGISFLNYQGANDSLLFFYHTLVSPLKQHAVYFSLLVIIGLIFLLESIAKKDFLLTRLFHICLILYLSIFLFLLSSKLVIVFYLFYLLFYFIRILKRNRLNRLAVTGSIILSLTFVSLVFAIRNPVSERFYEIIKGDIKVITQDRFDKGDYFNGLQFRLLQWKFVAEILNENNRWWTGVSPGDAQHLLNKKYISKNMYTGDPERADRGYLIYNTHNQFLETLLQNGIIGLGVLLIICFSLLKMAMQKKSRMASFIVLLLLAWLFTESAFETQYGILIFTFFPLFVCTGKISNAGAFKKANHVKTYSDW